MNLIKYLERFIAYQSLKVRSPHSLARALCWGIYIAFSPFPLLHTVQTALCAWVCGLNFFVILAAGNMVNNPWTLVPVYSADYFFGDMLLNRILGLNSHLYNPEWMSALNTKLSLYLGIDNVCLWSFLIGGNLLGIILALSAYPFILSISQRVMNKQSISPSIESV
ncbi:hypothetical protein J120_00700 [candidate division TM6 bacterium JCVI TM6SC1]|uniref:DUF2062 domain-containing protein n=1 Tax=candidate division TM6 bacterium JCVI TM6SC1 TaxID=1306947 RepID=A0A0D2K5G1_9BACT|nr:hypothetical protein J120_00700 [candidate division TM6 bacterium JCVI TM6SC1]